MEVDKGELRRIRLIPVLIYYMQVNRASEEDYRETVRRMIELSKEFGTMIKETDEGVFIKLE